MGSMESVESYAVTDKLGPVADFVSWYFKGTTSIVAEDNPLAVENTDGLVGRVDDDAIYGLTITRPEFSESELSDRDVSFVTGLALGAVLSQRGQLPEEIRAVVDEVNLWMERSTDD